MLNEPGIEQITGPLKEQLASTEFRAELESLISENPLMEPLVTALNDFNKNEQTTPSYYSRQYYLFSIINLLERNPAIQEELTGFLAEKIVLPELAEFELELPITNDLTVSGADTSSSSKDRNPLLILSQAAVDLAILGTILMYLLLNHSQGNSADFPQLFSEVVKMISIEG